MEDLEDLEMEDEGDNCTNAGDPNRNIKNGKSTLFTCLMWASFVMAISGVSKLQSSQYCYVDC